VGGQYITIDVTDLGLSKSQVGFGGLRIVKCVYIKYMLTS
jgi:hypothetical protein